ncbi:MAG: hypothetical protein JWL81_3300 [Verrucomicrobiales bacterium]|nr:hypothetical protein [Verrucomicrobiales bacterium]
MDGGGKEMLQHPKTNPDFVISIIFLEIKLMRGIFQAMRVLSEYPIAPSPLRSLLQRPLLWLLVIGMLAMGGALRADFYMDDFGFILNSKGDAPNGFRWYWDGQAYGSAAPDAMDTSIFQVLPTLMTLLTNALFPLNPMAAHGWNLSIHLLLAVLIFRLGERLLRRLDLLASPQARTQAAFIGALIFVCHPLATEPVHYAKCHMVQLVALFSFWATCEALDFMAAPSRKTAWRFGIAALLCVLSYFPGAVLLGLNLLAVFCYFLTSPGGREKLAGLRPTLAFLRRPGMVLLISGSVIFAAWLGLYFIRRFVAVLDSWGEMYPVHVVTQGRVFWEYLQRIFVPVQLASDHYQPWSTWRDTGAVLRLAGFALLLTGVAVMAFRSGRTARRSVGLLFVFCLIPFAMRMLYVNIEIMVEYRAYHALPWVGLLGGCGLVRLAGRWRESKLRWLPAAALVLVFTALSAERGAVWRSGASLAENVLSQYPLNNRARTQLQSFDLDAGEYGAVLERHAEILAVREEITRLNAATGGVKVIDTLRADTNVIGSYQFAVLARAEVEGCLKALAFADQSIASLKQTFPHQFTEKPGQGGPGAWPLLEARSAVQKAQDAGYAGNPELAVPGRP